MGILKYLLSVGSKHSAEPKAEGEGNGFTLIELLVSIILATLVLTPLLGFMIDILQTDRREQAKTSTEQELRAAADYIARDLSEAVYIYDQEGLAAITGDYAPTTCSGAACDSDPTGSSNLPSRDFPELEGSVPVLVFWKRAILRQGRELNAGSNNGDDGFVYSLVAYYLQNNDDPEWSDASRITRFEMKGQLTGANGVSIWGPQPGYEAFELDEVGSLQDIMNAWHKSQTTDYDLTLGVSSTPSTVLVDYIDPSPFDTPDLPSETCPSEDTIQNGQLDSGEDTNGNGDLDVWTQVPDYNLLPTPEDDALKNYSFYACVKSIGPGANNIARVFLRGNSLARLRIYNTIPVYDPQVDNFFPRTRLEIRTNGSL